MLEICVHQVSAELLQYQATGEVAARNGNRVRDAAPHGIFACRDGGWIAIAVSSDTQWKALGEVAGAPNWAVDTRFATLSARKLHEDELELAVGGWTADRDAHQLMSALQAAGVAAGVVQDAPELLDTDPQLRARGGLLTQLDHPVIGVHGLPQPPFRLSLTPASVTRAPLFGEHTEQVCTGLLGFSDAEYANLVEERVLS
jgi:crotonobetainyl-CoA:carnitine CoA-transferase CaiB-like acyl-CoA transferase